MNTYFQKKLANAKLTLGEMSGGYHRDGCRDEEAWLSWELKNNLGRPLCPSKSWSLDLPPGVGEFPTVVGAYIRAPHSRLDWDDL